MEDPRNMEVEPAGVSEGDWSAAAPSSAGLPEYVEGEFSHLITRGAKSKALSEEDRGNLLKEHMAALLKAGGDGSASDASLDESLGFLARITSRLPGRQGSGE